MLNTLEKKNSQALLRPWGLPAGVPMFGAPNILEMPRYDCLGREREERVVVATKLSTHRSAPGSCLSAALAAAAQDPQRRNLFDVETPLQAPRPMAPE